MLMLVELQWFILKHVLVIKNNIMKKILILIGLCGLISSCEIENKPEDKSVGVMTAQEYFDYKIRKSKIVNRDGHELILYESGQRNFQNYSFSIEHSPTCKMCYEIYD